jgi:acetyl esterase/lipase
MVRMLMVGVLMFAAAGFSGLSAQNDPNKKTDKKAEKKPAAPLPPTAQIKYGPHERQVIDFWQAKSSTPTPVVLYIHGGGWRGGDKSSVGAANIKAWNDAGISVAAINYRYIDQAVAEKVEPPVKAPLHDAARALQTIRSKAKEWNIDKKRIGATGGSAGGCSSLWLALHDDLADPTNADPIARESTRLYCAAVNGAQTSLDPKELRAWMPNYKYGAHAFGLKDLDEVLQKRDSVMKWIKEYSPIEHVSKDDPPIAMFYKGETNPKFGDSPKDPTHSALLGVGLAERLKSAGVEVLLVYPGTTGNAFTNSTDYLIDRLRK